MSNNTVVPIDYDELEKGTNTTIKKKPDKKPINMVLCCADLTVILFVSIFMIPFGICSVYYAYTDNSCIALKAGKLYVTLKDYLAVDGLLFLILYTIIVFCIIYKPDNIVKTYSSLIRIVSLTIKGFTASWLVLGASIFWKQIDNNECEDGIYNYVYASLIIKIIFTIMEILSNMGREKR